MQRYLLDAEWLEADGLGGFATGTVGSARTRRYHALLVASSTPPTGRFALVGGLDAAVDTPAGRFALSSQRYDRGVTHPDGEKRLVAFDPDPWPQWLFQLEDGTRVSQELFVVHDRPLTAIRWRVDAPPSGPAGPRRLVVHPYLSGRDIHSLHRRNDAFRFTPQVRGSRVTFMPYEGVPSVCFQHNGRFTPRADWHERFLYEEERARGFDALEDLAAPAEFEFDLQHGDAILLMAAGNEPLGDAPSALALFERLRAAEAVRRAAFPSPLHRAAGAYVARRGNGRTIVAGYPWFTDWGRDTFIALRGLLLATGRLDEARDVLVPWTSAVSEGMLPNFFPERGREPEFNSVDASLWFVIAAGEWTQAMRAARRRVRAADREALAGAVGEILGRHERGTRYGIHADRDGLLFAGAPGMQLTWMDARADGRVVTPRAGKPVEVQALWVNALSAGAAFARENGEHASAARMDSLRARAVASFQAKFWNDDRGFLYDVVDTGPGTEPDAGPPDPSFRPNQVLAVGGLPIRLLEGSRAWSVVEAIEQHLLTPLGLRSLAPGEPGYCARYEGGPTARDAAYHQGTAWPWLLGPFVDAWVRVNGGDDAARKRARDRFLPPLRAHLPAAGLGHVSEIADAESPFTPRGCPFQAWSVGELLRLELEILREPADSPATPHGAAPRHPKAAKKTPPAK